MAIVATSIVVALVVLYCVVGYATYQAYKVNEWFAFVFGVVMFIVGIDFIAICVTIKPISL